MKSYNVSKKDKKSGKGLRGSEEAEFIILLYIDGLLASCYGPTDSLAVKKPIADAVRPHRHWYNSYAYRTLEHEYRTVIADPDAYRTLVIRAEIISTTVTTKLLVRYNIL